MENDSFNEFYHNRTGLSIGITDRLFSEESDYQKVEVYETDTWGNLLVIDGMVMLSERDEFVYHEMLAHVPLCTHPRPERVLIVGGGDGGTAREVMKHESVREVDMVEIDETVIRASKQYLPGVGDWDNPKLNVLVEDGIAFVEEIKNPYDLIIIDGSDPIGPAEGLFGKGFMQACHNSLAEDGILVAQSESPWVESYHPTIAGVNAAMDALFRRAALYLAYIPLYPAGMWSFTLGSKVVSPRDEATVAGIEERTAPFADTLSYYNREVHLGAFALPNFVREIIAAD